MIQASTLTKWYGPVRAVDELTFAIPKGEIVGFLGPNGAGKSTTIRMLTGYLPPTAGTAAIAGHDVLTDAAAARRQIGYLPESTPLYLEMRVDEYLHYRGRLMGMPRKHRRDRVSAVCDRCGLAHNRRRVIGQLSKGNRQRVGIAQALLHEPPVLILDEPTAGLDPVQIGEVRKLIDELRGKHTVLLSSHILPEVEKSADRVIIIAGGRIVAEGTPDELRQKVRRGGRIIVEAKADAKQLEAALKQVQHVAGVQVEANNGWCRSIVTPSGDNDVREAIGQALVQRGYPLREMRHETASLEAFFVQITAEQESGVSGQSSVQAEG
ncbi:ABC transporter ATP-binding protein [Phycisphaerales bacterium AB-hyl4]|uniref:ABC transporter ATP-binding protein n=1 Tax=Natronomicrosphaera hydrolytica TaxID=3242702 RepID=A0ABV4UBQ2_9BACT